MALSDFKLKALKPIPGRRLEVADEHGLYVEVMPTGSKVWRYRYALHGRREKVTVGPYPEVGVSEARKRRLAFSEMVERGESPAKAKQRDKAANRSADSVRQFGESYIADVIRARFRRAKDAERYFTRDIFPALGNYRLAEVTPADVLRLIDGVKARGRKKVQDSERAGRRAPAAGGDQAAKQVQTLLKGMFNFAIDRQLLTYNPASVIPSRSVALGSRRDRALSHDELKLFVRGLNQTVDTKSLVAAMKLILLTLVRKGELTNARWDNVNLEKLEWRLPTSKTGDPHFVPLSTQAGKLFSELQVLAGDSKWVLPGRNAERPISEHTLNAMLARHSMYGVTNLVIHDLRRTGSTMLHERGFSPDVIEKALNHSIGGIRGVYNVAKYAEQRRTMLQEWADYIDSLSSADSQ